MQLVKERLSQAHARLVQDIALVQTEGCVRLLLHAPATQTLVTCLDALESIADANADDAPADFIRAR